MKLSSSSLFHWSDLDTGDAPVYKSTTHTPVEHETAREDDEAQMKEIAELYSIIRDIDEEIVRLKERLRQLNRTQDNG